MNDPDALDTQEAIKAMEDEIEPEDPTEDDEDEAEFSVSERKLLWGVIIVLGVFALLEGAVIVNWGSRIRSMERGGPGGPDGGALFAGGGGSADPGISAGPGGMVAGQTAVRQVTEEFGIEKELDEETRRKLVELMGETEAELESIPQRQRSGEIDANDAADVMQEQWDRRKKEARELIGEDLAAELESIMSGGEVAMTPPTAPPAEGDPDAAPPELVDPDAAPPEIVEPNGQPPVPPSEAGAPPE